MPLIDKFSKQCPDNAVNFSREKKNKSKGKTSAKQNIQNLVSKHTNKFFLQ